MTHRKLDYIDYDESYRVGIKEMDMQHERLFSIYNGFVNNYNSKGGLSHAELEKVFNEMFWYTKYHFREEEWIMRTYKYPNARAHVEQHRFIIDKLTKIFVESTSEESMVSALDTFIDIWANHIIEVDKLYVEFIMTY